jgi:hypothetical protein
MDNLVKMYEALGDDMFNINFDNLSLPGLRELNDIIENLRQHGTEITFDAILKEAVTPEVAEVIQSA